MEWEIARVGAMAALREFAAFAAALTLLVWLERQGRITSAGRAGAFEAFVA